GNDACMRRLAALSSKGCWREIRAVGFHHKFPERDFCRDLSYGCAVFESDNPRERKEAVQIKNLIGLIERATEAMEDSAHLAGVRPDGFKCVLPRIALMDHYV